MSNLPRRDVSAAKQQAALVRAYLVDYFRSAAPDFRCTDETLLTGMMCRFADMNFTEQSQKVQQEYLKVYERRKARLQEQIDALQAKAEAEEKVASMQETPDFEPEELPDLCGRDARRRAVAGAAYYSAGSRYRTRHPECRRR